MRAVDPQTGETVEMVTIPVRIVDRALAILAHTLNASDHYYPDEATFRGALGIRTELQNYRDGYWQAPS